MKKSIIIVSCLVFLLSLVPFNTTFLPDMTVRVVDERGNPYVGEFVVQNCTNYTMGIHPCEEVNDTSKPTDENGYITFPARKLRANLLYRIVRPVAGLLLLIANGEYGTNASISTSGPQGNKRVEFKAEGPYPTEIMLPSKDFDTSNSGPR